MITLFFFFVIPYKKSFQQTLYLRCERVVKRSSGMSEKMGDGICAKYGSKVAKYWFPSFALRKPLVVVFPWSQVPLSCLPQLLDWPIKVLMWFDCFFQGFRGAVLVIEWYGSPMGILGGIMYLWNLQSKNFCCSVLQDPIEGDCLKCGIKDENIHTVTAARNVTDKR